MPLCFGAGSHGRLACLWVAVLAGWIEFIAHAGAPLDKLFSEPEAIARAQANPPRGAKRFRPARLNANLTQDNSSPAFTPLSQFVLNLFPDLQPQVQITQVDALGEGRRVSHGVIDGIPGSHFLLAENSGVITASVFIPGRGSYNIISQGGFNYTITEIDPAQAGDCGADELIAPAKTGHASTVTAAAQLSPPPVIGAQLGPTTDPVSIVDVMVVYTPESLAGAGGTAAMTSLIDLAIAEGNTVYQNSRANVRLRLAYQGLINYAESDSFRTNLTRLQAPGDGFMDDVFALRDTARADVVCLITERGETNLSGLAFTLSTDVAGFKAQAFSVVKRSAAVGTYMFVHEISHNLGCQHDRENALDVNGKPNVPVYSFSYGYRFTAGGVLYRDVMAYAPGQPVPFFSNPRIVFNNVPMGVAEGATNACDNARTLSMTAPVVSAFYGPATTTVPPAVGITAPADGATFLSGNNVNITVTALDADTLLKQVEIYTNSTLAAVIPGNLMGTYHLTLPSSPPGDFSLVARALDNLGAASATLPLTFSVRPDNDNAAQAILLQGTSVTVTGSNRAATLEAGEPKHTGNPGGRSVWYSWTAPRSGSVDVVATGVSVYPLADVYLAGPLATRVSVAQGIHFTSGAFVETTYFNTVAGQNYWIAVDSLGGVGDDFTLQMIYAPLPANDDYQNATVVAGQSFSVSGSNVGATTEPGETHHANNPSNKTVWYAWTAPRDGTVNLTSVSSSFFPLSDVYLGATLATATNAPDIFHHFDTTNLTESSHFEAHAGVTYQIVVGGVKDSQGAFTLSLAYDPAPANDLFANRQSITGSVIHLTGTVAGASFESGEPQHDDNPGGHSVWYAWVAPVSGTVTVKVDGSQFFPLVDVYTGTIVNGLARVLTAVSFDNTNLVTTAVFAAVAGRAYALAVDGYSGLTGPFALELTTANIPATLQPVQADVSSGKFGFTFGGNPGSPFVVQASADLVNWITVTQGTVGAEPFHFSEALLPGPHTRFFRVRPAP